MKRAAIAILLLAAVSTAAGATDLTGTWEGKQSCKLFDGVTVKTKSDPPSMLEITQNGSALNIAVDGILPYGGYMVDDADKPNRGEVGLLQCGTSQAAGEVGRMQVKTNPGNGKGNFKGSSTFVKDGLIVVCGWKYKRLSTVDPFIAACP